VASKTIEALGSTFCLFLSWYFIASSSPSNVSSATSE
jgi:hypothetical protein